MFDAIRDWFKMKWRLQRQEGIETAYLMTFSSEAGRLVLQDMLDSIYCVVYEGNDPVACVAHNARRSVVQEILENMDRAANPAKYMVNGA